MIACVYTPQIGTALERARLPQLREQPLVLLDGELVKVADRVASARGIFAGLAATTARALCPGLIAVPYDREYYFAGAEAVWDLTAVETSVVEPVAPEFCFADLSGAGVDERARSLAAQIAQRSGTPVSIGLGESKLVARAAARNACHIGKESVLRIVGQETAALLYPLPLADLLVAFPHPFIERCRRLGVSTLGDLAEIPRSERQRQFSKPVARRLARLMRGIDDDPVQALWPKPSMLVRRVFDEEIGDLRAIHASLQEVTGEIAERLALVGMFCRTLSLAIKCADQLDLCLTERLPGPQRSAQPLFQAAVRLFTRLHVEQPLIELSMTASDIDAGAGLQLTLLDNNAQGHGYPHERRQNLLAAIRHARRKYGAGAVVSGMQLVPTGPTGCWTYSLGKRRDEIVRVTTDEAQQPIRYCRMPRNSCPIVCEIAAVTDRWRENVWCWGVSENVDCFRVLTVNGGIQELHRRGQEWRLCGVAD